MVHETKVKDPLTSIYHVSFVGSAFEFFTNTQNWQLCVPTYLQFASFILQDCRFHCSYSFLMAELKRSCRILEFMRVSEKLYQTIKSVIVRCEFDSHWRQCLFLLIFFGNPWCLNCAKLSALSFCKPSRVSIDYVDVFTQSRTSTRNRTNGFPS